MKRIVMALLLLFSVPALAQYDKKPRIISRSTEVFNNTNCADTDTCDLVQIRYLAEDYEIWIDTGMHYGTRLFAHYRTKNVSSLENYAFVQFIKGCQYHSSVLDNQTGKIVREHFSKIVVFNHKDWVIDSIDTDPVYFSTFNSRHFYYKWNIKPGSTNENTEKFYGFEKPLFLELYITDHPGTAFYFDGIAKNISLIFKTCLYKTLDVPQKTIPENIDFAKPISCFYWYSSWAYNHNTEKFENPYEIAPACNK